MDKVTLNDFRSAVASDFGCKIEKMSDEELLKVNLKTDLGMDSLDEIELSMNLDEITGLYISDYLEFAPGEEHSVQNYLNLWNSY